MRPEAMTDAFESELRRVVAAFEGAIDGLAPDTVSLPALYLGVSIVRAGVREMLVQGGATPDDILALDSNPSVQP
jgi:hypothetical protein